MSAHAALLMPAAGAGRRMGGTAKPFIELAGEPVLLHALRPFLAEPRIHLAVVALPGELAADPPAWLTGLDPRVRIAAGGAERSDSVRAALESLPPEVDVVLVHDAARPLVTARLVASVLDAAAAGRCVVAAVQAADTIHRVDAALHVVDTPDRAALWQAQTPQAFPRRVLEEAHARAAHERAGATDDAGLVRRYGATVDVIEGERGNIKITVASDLIVAEALLRARRCVET